MNDGKTVDLQKLISRGRNKGFLTYDEVNRALSDEVSSDLMDDVVMVLEEMDIELVDDPSKAKAVKEGSYVLDDDGQGDDDNETGSSSAAMSAEDGRAGDPVKMYLREMGLVSLLTREGEVEIAKRIEKGERKTLDSLLESSLCVQVILDLGQNLENGAIRIRDVVGDVDEEESLEGEEARAMEFMAVIENVRRIDRKKRQRL